MTHLAITLVAGIAAITSCSKNTSESQPAGDLVITEIPQIQNSDSHISPAPEIANEISIALDSEPAHLDWQSSLTDDEYFVVSFLMSGLMQYQDTTLKCLLCKSYEASADGTQYRFQIDQSRKWSDGRPVSAQDFLDAYSRLKSMKKNLPFKAHLLQKQASNPEPELIYTLDKANRGFLHWLTTPESFPIRKDALGNPSRDRGITMGLTVTGPYLLAEWQRAQRMVLESNPEYSGPRPVHRTQLVFGDRNKLIEQFKENKLRLHVLSNPTTNDIIQLRGASLKVSSYWATRWLTINVNKSPGSETEIRRAMLYALDRDQLPGYLRNGDKAAAHLIPPGVLGHQDQGVKANLKSAQGARHRAVDWSKWLELNLLVLNQPMELKLAAWISEQLKEIKIRVNIRSENQMAYDKGLKQGDFDIALITRGMRTASPLELLEVFQSQSPENYGAWSFDAYDNLIEKARVEKDEETFKQTLLQLTKLLEENQVAVIPLTYPIRPFLLNPRVQNFSVTPFGNLDLFKILVQK